MPETDDKLPRAARRAATLERIKDRARAQLARAGPGGLSLRAIARELGMVSSNVYRYYASRDDLITGLLVDAYIELAEELERSPRDFAARAVALRRWAIGAPHQFALVYGSAIPDYSAPPETIGLAARVVGAFAAVVDPRGSRPGGSGDGGAGDVGAAGRARPAGAGEDPPATPVLAEQAGRMGAVIGVSPGQALRLANALSALIGHLTLELNGHFVGTFEPADALYELRAAQLAGELGDAPH
ncbi:TetR/AcrR family transcriptional regulator [Pseudoclavibacter endophyticus]|nr:TetR/AcrR family transcriptional regulator [Pseudoclavibacter endophyticus]